MNAKRPDLCMLVKNALLFVGEHVSEEGKLDLAVFRLKQKMRQWSRTVSAAYCGAMQMCTMNAERGLFCDTGGIFALLCNGGRPSQDVHAAP